MTQSERDDVMLSITEAAQKLSISVFTIYHMIRDKKIKLPKFQDRYVVGRDAFRTIRDLVGERREKKE